MPNIKQVIASGALQIIRVNVAGTAIEVDSGLTIGTGGALQTTGVGTGSVVGNSRGAGAVDLQNARSAATGVASGINSFVANQFNTGQGEAAPFLATETTASMTMF